MSKIDLQLLQVQVFIPTTLADDRSAVIAVSTDSRPHTAADKFAVSLTMRAAKTVLATHETLTSPKLCHSAIDLKQLNYRDTFYLNITTRKMNKSLYIPGRASWIMRMDSKGKLHVLGKDTPLPRPPIRRSADPRADCLAHLYSSKNLAARVTLNVW
ncbi:hypothetical protein J6590_057692 [Homalodisca vitripennis]|nr:hypothetical protein J6590_057692 [Homalodisca vitripennis]